MPVGNLFNMSHCCLQGPAVHHGLGRTPALYIKKKKKKNLSAKQFVSVWQKAKRYSHRLGGKYANTATAEPPWHRAPCIGRQNIVCYVLPNPKYKLLYTSFFFFSCLLYRIRTETMLMAWLDLWLWDVITLRLVIWCFIWREKPINSTALQSDNVIMALATQDKQIALLLVKAFPGFTLLDLESAFTPTFPNVHFPPD